MHHFIQNIWILLSKKMKGVIKMHTGPKLNDAKKNLTEMSAKRVVWLGVAELIECWPKMLNCLQSM